jgi:hypothetical protein
MVEEERIHDHTQLTASDEEARERAPELRKLAKGEDVVFEEDDPSQIIKPQMARYGDENGGGCDGSV